MGFKTHSRSNFKGGGGVRACCAPLWISHWILRLILPCDCHSCTVPLKEVFLVPSFHKQHYFRYRYIQIHPRFHNAMLSLFVTLLYMYVHVFYISAMPLWISEAITHKKTKKASIITAPKIMVRL